MSRLMLLLMVMFVVFVACVVAFVFVVFVYVSFLLNSTRIAGFTLSYLSVNFCEKCFCCCCCCLPLVGGVFFFLLWEVPLSIGNCSGVSVSCTELQLYTLIKYFYRLLMKIIDFYFPLFSGWWFYFFVPCGK